MQERHNEYMEELQGLHESLLFLKLTIRKLRERYSRGKSKSLSLFQRAVRIVILAILCRISI